MLLQNMPARQSRELRDAAGNAPLSNPGVEYPEWYMRRWHFLPEGYLSARSAAGYDYLVRNVYNAFQEPRIVRETVRRIAAFRPESVLEVGTGPGRLLSKLARIRSMKRLTGVDLSPYLLERATERLGGRNVELVHANGLSLPVGSGDYDVATASHYVGHLPEPARRQAVEELARSIRTGGHLVIVDHRWHSWPESDLFREMSDALLALGTVRVSVFRRVGGVSA
jgi:ubiquinone/menaquinone biosynthesis C-methylase UbiE